MNIHLPHSILLVEDSLTARFHAQLCLKKGLPGQYELHHAECLQTAKAILASSMIDVILLDLSLPDSHGLQTFREINRVCGDAAIIIISADTDERTAVRAVGLGAQDYIVKGEGFTPEALGRAVRFAIERNARHLLERELADVRHDLQIADAIQQRLYPHGEARFANITIAGRSSSAAQNCGDYYDYVLRGDGSLLVVIGDVSGHGIGPAMMMIETRAFVRGLAASMMSLGEILTHVNRLIAEDMQQHLFVTLFIASFDPTGQRLSFCSAGHPGFLISKNGHVRKLQTDNLPAGVAPHETYSAVEVNDFQCGDLLALFTDGISEATYDHLDFLGNDRVIEEVVSGRERSASEILESLFRLADGFDGAELQKDDRTAVIVKTQAECW